MAGKSILERIEQDAQKALLQNAFFRLESAITVSGAILLAAFFQPFPWWPWWAWLILGLIAEVAIVVSSLTDANERQRVIESLFREQYNTGGIRDKHLRAKLAEAEQYRRRIHEVISQQKRGLLRDRMAGTTNQIYDWIAGMIRLARRIDTYRMDEIIDRDREMVPKEIKELTARLNLETNPRVQTQISNTLASKRQLAHNLEELADRMERADLQLDHSLAALGTVYSQLLLIGSTEVDSDRAERLRDDIGNEVAALQDLVESLNEVYGYEAMPDENGRPTADDRQRTASKRRTTGN